MKHTHLPTLVLIILCPVMLHAQYNRSNNEAGNNYLYLSEGIISGAEINGWAGPPVLSGYVSMPSAVTGAIFVTYRHFLTERFALGFTAGMDMESGDLSYGNPEMTSTGLDGVSGHYKMHAYTFAPEALLAYFKRDKVMMYGCVGAGVTFYDDKCTIDPNAPYGPPVALPSNPYDYHRTNFNFQVTGFGIRFGGNIAGFVEIGAGYMGVFSGGLSTRF